jgi:hypothetical protein
MPHYRLVETSKGAVTARRELSRDDLRRERPELIGLLDEGLVAAHIVTRKREMHVVNVVEDDERLRQALRYGGYAGTDEEARRLIAALRQMATPLAGGETPH